MDTIKAEKEGETVGVADIRSVLNLRYLPRGSMDISNISVDDIREFYQKKLTDSVGAIEGEDIDVHKLESVLQTMDVKLSENQMSDLMKNLLVDDNGKTSFSSLLDYVTAVVAKDLGIEDRKKVPEDVKSEHRDKVKRESMRSQQADEWTPASKKLDSLLQSMGINLAEEEINELLQNLPAEGGKVKLDNVDTVLENLGVKLTPKEQERLMKKLPSRVKSSDGKIPLNQLVDAITKVTGEEVNVKDIKSTLEKMGIELTDEECSQVESMLPINANGMVYQNRLLEGVLSSKSGIVNVASIDTILPHMDMELTEMEKEDLVEKLPVDGNKKVELKNLLNALKTYTGKKIDVNDLLQVMRDMGIELNKREEETLLHALPVDDAGMVFQNRLLEEVKSRKGGMVKVNNLDTVLGSLGIKLTDKEHESLTENLPLTADGKIHLEKVLDTVESITGGDIDVCDVANVLKKMGITLTDNEHRDLLEQLPISADEKVHKNRMMDGLKSLSHGTVDVNKIDTILKNMGWKLTNDEIKDLKKNVPADVHGKVSMKNLLKGLDAFTGPKLDMRFLPAMINKMGLELTDKERMKLMNELPVDDSGKIYKNRLLNEVKSFEGGKVKTNKINTLLETMGIKLEEKELDQLKENLPDNGDGKINFQDLMNEVKALIGNEENIKDVKNILEDMGVELTQQEYADLLKNLPVDVDGNSYHNRLMDTLKSLKRGKADVNKLDTVVKNMGRKVSGTEFEDMTKSLPVHAGKIEMKKLINAMRAFTGNKIAISDLQDVLGSMGIELTDKMLSDLQKALPVDDDEMVFQNRLLDEVKSLKGGKIDVNNIDTILENMGIKLTEAELKDLAEALPVDANGKVELTKLMDEVKALTGGETDINDVKNVLKKMGIELTEKEMLKLLKNLPVNEDGKIYHNRLMDSLKSLSGGTISASKLDSLLGSMGMKLNEKEFENLTQKLQRDVNGNVSLKKVMDELKNLSGNKLAVSGLQSYLRSLGVELTDSECSKLKDTLPTDAAGKLYENRVLDAVQSLKGGMVNLSDLNKALGNMGIELTEKERKHLNDDLLAKAEGKIGLNKLLDEVKAIRGEPIAMADLEDVLGNMGVELTNKEFRKLVEKLQADAGGKTYQKRLLEGLKTFTEGRIKAGKVDTFLKNMGVDISEKELKDLTQSLPVSADGKVDIKTIMKEAKTFTGEKMNVNNLEDMLRKAGLEFNDLEYSKLVKTLPVDDNGMVHWARVLKGVKSLKGGKLDVKNLYPFLENMGIKLLNKEVEQLRESLPVDANGKVDINKVLDGAKTFTGEKIGIGDVKTVLEKMGLEYKDQEFSKLMESLQFDDDGKIFQNRLLEKVKSLKGGKVSSNNLKTLVDSLGIKLKDNEFKDLVQNLPTGALRKVSIDTLMKKLNAFTGDKVDSSDLRNILKNLGVELTEREQERLLKTLPADDSGKVYYNRVLKGVKSFNEGKVQVNNLGGFLKNLGIKLNEEEFAKLSEDLPVDDDGKADLKKVTDRVRAITGGEVDNKNVKPVLSKIGIELSDKEFSKVMEKLPFDDDNKVFKNRLLDVVKSLKGGKVDVNNLNTVLGNMGIKLSNMELRDLSQSIHVGVDEKIPLQTLMEKLKDYAGEKISPHDVPSVLANLDVELTDKELEDLMKPLPLDDTGKLSTNRLLKGVKDLKVGKIKKDNLHSSLENMGIKLSMEEFAEVTENLDTDAKGNADLPKVMERVKAVTENVNIKNLENALGNMGIKLSSKELEDLTKNLPVSADKKVPLKILKDEAKAFTGEKVDSRNLQNVLKNVGIELSDKELNQVLKTLPTDDHGKVFQNRLMKEVKSHKRGQVDINNLDAALDALNIKLTEKELEQTKAGLSGGHKKIDLGKLMDKVQCITGKEVDVHDAAKVLQDMGIELTDSQLSKIVNNVPVDDGKVYLRRLLDGMQFFKGPKVDASRVDTVLGNMGMNLNQRELQDLIKNLEVDENNKVDVKRVISEAKSFTGEKVDTNRLPNVLDTFGISLRPYESSKLLDMLPVNDDGRVFQKKLVKAVKSLDEGSVDIDSLDTFLENMGIEMTEKEFMDLTTRLPETSEGKVKLNNLMKEVYAILGEPIDVYDLEDTLGDMKVELTDRDYMTLMRSLPRDASGKVFKKRILDGIKTLKRGKVDVNNLSPFLETMGLDLSQKEFEDFVENLPVDENGKVDMKNIVAKSKDFEGEKIGVGGLKNTVGEIGVDLSDREYVNLLETLPFDENNKVFLNRLLSSLRAFKGGRVDPNNVKTLLQNLGLKLKNKELRSVVRKQAAADANRSIPLKKILADVNSVVGEKVSAKDVKSFLEAAGITLTPKEYLELMRNLPTDDNGNIYENRLIDCLKSFEGGTVDVNNLENALENLKIKLSDEKLKDLSENLPFDASGKIDLQRLMKEVRKFTGGKIDAKLAQRVLGNMGIEFTNREVNELMKRLPVADDGKILKNIFLDHVKWFPGGKCHASKMDAILEDMGYELEDEEIEDLQSHLPIEDGKVKLSKMMENVESFTGYESELLEGGDTTTGEELEGISPRTTLTNTTLTITLTLTITITSTLTITLTIIITITITTFTSTLTSPPSPSSLSFDHFEEI
ncbi:uncharacterized protein LOC131917107 [Peromyscus eremicus]|uniref:uncharacterized protein LOC131917107 n=1 Tax=Peromyscus eremicus TaxID=42410 RepID=UPI0027DB9C3C|nr:uncharacterized protein LOC131917107 [Peromyscus eremicus]